MSNGFGSRSGSRLYEKTLLADNKTRRLKVFIEQTMKILMIELFHEAIFPYDKAKVMRLNKLIDSKSANDA